MTRALQIAHLALLIAATALVNGLTVVTRNARDFPSTLVHLVNPWAQGLG